ncbi:MAG: hypothetical protein E7664_00645 [Ruminococcaceae bacterium]|nr:hypothetical protein [Oscillospiraceae bacterium]
MPSKRRAWLLCVLCLLAFSLFLMNADAAMSGIRHALHLCAATVIPSLFPFTVLSSVLVQSGAAAALGRHMQKPLRLLFGIRNGGEAWLLGILCGYPVGTSVAVALYDRHELDRASLMRLLCAVNLPSSAFVIGTVGTAMLGNRSLGILLYGACLAGGTLSAVTVCRFLPKPEGRAEAVSLPRMPPRRMTAVCCEAVTLSASQMLSVCGFILFFGALVSVLSALTEPLLPSGIVRTLLFGALEVTGGVSLSHALTPSLAAILTTAVILGWSGLSVHAQIAALAAPTGVSLRPYLVSKALSALLCALLTACLLPLVPHPALSLSQPALRDSASSLDLLPILAIALLSTLHRPSKKTI